MVSENSFQARTRQKGLDSPMNSMYLWERVSGAGLPAAIDRELERRVMLCNQIGFCIGLALLLGAINHLAWGYTVLAPFMMVFSLLYFLVPYLNARGHLTASRIYLMVLPPILITLLSGLILHRDGSFKFALIPVILVPILVFGITERGKMLAGIAWVVAAFLAMDVVTPFIPPLEGVTISDGEISQNAKVNGLITFFMFTASFVYFQRLNQKAERALSESLEKVQAQKEIIEQQKKEEQEQALLALSKEREVNALKSTFVAMTSHEFRTPLSAIFSSQELLRDFRNQMAVPERDELLGIIESATQRMMGMLDKILIIGQVDADLMEFRPEPLNVAGVCRRLADEVLQSFRNTSPEVATIVLDVQIATCDLASLDENLLRHCLGNLLSNAVKYSPSGSEATLKVSQVEDAVVFEVVDHGIGIPREDLPRLFESFHRGGNVGTIPGTGLGLAIVMRAVERHGGTIEVTSEIGKGTCFTVSLPQINVPQSSVVQTSI